VALSGAWRPSICYTSHRSITATYYSKYNNCHYYCHYTAIIVQQYIVQYICTELHVYGGRAGNCVPRYTIPHLRYESLV